MLLCCPFFNWEGAAAPFFEIQQQRVARYAHPCAPRLKRRPWRFDPTEDDFKKQQKARVTAFTDSLPECRHSTSVILIRAIDSFGVRDAQLVGGIDGFGARAFCYY